MSTWKSRASTASVTGACVFALVAGAGAVFAGDWWGQHHGPVVVQFINGPAGDTQAKQTHAGRVHVRRSPALTKSTVRAGPESDVNKPYPQASQVSPAPLRATERAAPGMATCGSRMAENGLTMVQTGASAPVRTLCTSSPAAPSAPAPSAPAPSAPAPSAPAPSAPAPSAPAPSAPAPSAPAPSAPAPSAPAPSAPAPSAPAPSAPAPSAPAPSAPAPSAPAPSAPAPSAPAPSAPAPSAPAPSAPAPSVRAVSSRAVSSRAVARVSPRRRVPRRRTRRQAQYCRAGERRAWGPASKTAEPTGPVSAAGKRR